MIKRTTTAIMDRRHSNTAVSMCREEVAMVGLKRARVLKLSKVIKTQVTD